MRLTLGARKAEGYRQGYMVIECIAKPALNLYEYQIL